MWDNIFFYLHNFADIQQSLKFDSNYTLFACDSIHGIWSNMTRNPQHHHHHTQIFTKPLANEKSKYIVCWWFNICILYTENSISMYRMEARIRTNLCDRTVRNGMNLSNSNSISWNANKFAIPCTPAFECIIYRQFLCVQTYQTINHVEKQIVEDSIHFIVAFIAIETILKSQSDKYICSENKIRAKSFSRFIRKVFELPVSEIN